MPSFLASGIALALFSLVLAGSVAHGAKAATAGEVNVYSYRQPYLIDPLLKDFAAKTGIKVNVIFAEKGLIKRIAAEGRNSPADVLLTVNVGNLMQAKDADIGQAVHSEVLAAAIPPTYRDTDGIWWGLTRRARVVYASKERVKLGQITYEDLADPKWQGKICIRSGQHVYNVALIASTIASHGEVETEQWLKAVKANLARKPAGDDRTRVEGVYAGECDIAIGNTHYMGAMLQDEKEPEQKEWANSVNMLFPNTNDRGTHANISGAVVAKYAPHKENAIRLLEFLASDEAQKMYAQVNNEYPVKEGVPWSALVQSWGSFKADPISLNEIASLRKKASELVDKVGFDERVRERDQG
ncbi:MAG: Fe(3+) ABC transporter substrate-binding protein [Methyloceanibacter sp.]